MFSRHFIAPVLLASLTLADQYVDKLNEYRAMMPRNSLAFDSQLQANSQKTVNDANGQLKTELNPGTFGQVVAQGQCTDDGFKNVLVFGWICERPELLPPGSCDGGNYIHDGSTGSADIVSSNSYTKAACACSQNIWACDFA